MVGRGICLAVAFWGWGCSPVEVRAAPAAMGMEVVNRSDRAIASIRHRACGSSEWTLYDGSALAPGARYLVPASHTAECHDLQAIDARGELVAEQRGAPVVSGASWSIE